MLFHQIDQPLLVEMDLCPHMQSQVTGWQSYGTVSGQRPYDICPAVFFYCIRNHLMVALTTHPVQNNPCYPDLRIKGLETLDHCSHAFSGRANIHYQDDRDVQQSR